MRVSGLTLIGSDDDELGKSICMGRGGISKNEVFLAQYSGVIPSWSRKQYLGTTMLLLMIAS